jgi:hypothetical protein
MVFTGITWPFHLLLPLYSIQSNRADENVLCGSNQCNMSAVNNANKGKIDFINYYYYLVPQFLFSKTPKDKNIPGREAAKPSVLGCGSRSRWCNGYRVCHWFTGSNSAESDGLLRTIKIRSTTSFGGEEKPSAPCRKILRHVKDPLRNDRDTDRQNSAAISRPVFPGSLLCCNQSRELRWMNQEWL